MEAFDYKEAIKVMEKHGYSHTGDNHAKTLLFFLKKIDDLHLHATVNLATRLIDLDTTGNLDLGIVMYCDSIDIENVKFQNFEKKLFNYLYLCVYGKLFYTHEISLLAFRGISNAIGEGKKSDGRPSDGNNGNESKIVPGGEVEVKGKPTPKPSIKERKNSLWEKVRQIGKEKKYDKNECLTFYKYWTEMNEGGKKMRFEMEKVFEVSKRLVTWMKNKKEWTPAWKQKDEKVAKKNQERPEIVNHKKLFQ